MLATSVLRGRTATDLPSPTRLELLIKVGEAFPRRTHSRVSLPGFYDAH